MDNIIKNLSPLDNSLLDSRKTKFQRTKRNLAAKVMLTSLIDAFSILVIYLLVNFSTTGEILYLSKGMELPAAAKTDVLERNTVVKIEKDKIFIEEKEVKVSQLAKVLLELRKQSDSKVTTAEETKESSLTIQADRRQEFKLLSPVIAAGGVAGFSDIHFAVMQD